jgi:hypothetical protein
MHLKVVFMPPVPVFPPIFVLLAQLHQLAYLGAFMCLEKELNARLPFIGATIHHFTSSAGTVVDGGVC